MGREDEADDGDGEGEHQITGRNCGARTRQVIVLQPISKHLHVNICANACFYKKNAVYYGIFGRSDSYG